MQCVLGSAAIEITAELRALAGSGLRRIETLLPDPAVTAHIALHRAGPRQRVDVSIPAGDGVVRGHGLAADTGTALLQALAGVEQACRVLPRAPGPDPASGPDERGRGGRAHEGGMAGGRGTVGGRRRGVLAGGSTPGAGRGAAGRGG